MHCSASPASFAPFLCGSGPADTQVLLFVLSLIQWHRCGGHDRPRLEEGGLSQTLTRSPVYSQPSLLQHGDATGAPSDASPGLRLLLYDVLSINKAIQRYRVDI